MIIKYYYEINLFNEITSIHIFLIFLLEDYNLKKKAKFDIHCKFFIFKNLKYNC